MLRHGGSLRSRLGATSALPAGVGGTIRISSNAVAEGAAAGLTIGTLSVTEAGAWTFSLVAGHDAGGRLALSGADLQTTATAFDYETATSHAYRVKAVRLSPYAEIVRELTINVTNVAEGAALGDLGLSATSFQTDAAVGAVLATFTNKTAGSTITTDDPRFAISGDSTQLLRGLGEWTVVASDSVQFTEAHPEAPNSPKANAISVSISDPPPVTYDYTVANKTELDAIIADMVLTPATYAGKTVGVAPGFYDQPAFENLVFTSTVKFIGTAAGVIFNRTLIADFDKLWFENIEGVSNSWSDTAPVGAWRMSGSMGEITFHKCSGMQGYNTDHTVRMEPTDLSNLLENGFYTDNRYPEQAMIMPTVDGTGAITALTISRKNIGNNTPTGALNGTWPLIFVGEGYVGPYAYSGMTGSGASGEFTVTNGVITSATLLTPGSGYTESGVGRIVAWENQKRFGSFMASAIYTTTERGPNTPIGPVTVSECNFFSAENGVTLPDFANGVHFLRNTCDGIYKDCFQVQSSDASHGAVHIAFNVGTRPLSAFGDPGDPHSDFVQLSMNNAGTGKWPVDVYANIAFIGTARGAFQGTLMGDPANTALDGYTVGPQGKGFIYNIYAVLSGNGFALTTGFEMVAAYNTIVTWDGVTSANARISTPAGTADQTHIAGNLTNGIGGLTDADTAIIAPNAIVGGVDYATIFAGSAGVRETVADILAAYATLPAYAAYGALHTGTPVDFVNQTINEAAIPVFVKFNPVGGATGGAPVTSNWSKLHGGASTINVVPAAGTRVRYADDKTGTNASVWYGDQEVQVPRGKYVQLEVTASATGSATAIGGAAFNGVTHQFKVTTTEATTFPAVSNVANPTLYSNLAAPSPDITNVDRVIFAWEARPVGAQGTEPKFFAAGSMSRLFARTDVFTLQANSSTDLSYRGNFTVDENWHRYIAAIDWSKTDEAEVIKFIRDASIAITRNTSGGNVRTDGAVVTSAAFLMTGGLGLFNEADGTSANLVGEYRMFWAYFGSSNPADPNYLEIPDIYDPAVAALWSPDNIGANGEVPLGRTPHYAFWGTAAEWNAGLANKGTIAATLTKVGAASYADGA